MPGGDRTGPMGEGPLTGRGLGPCGRGMRRGFGRGFGFRRNFAPVRADPYNTPYEPSQEEKVRILEQEKNAVEDELNSIKKEIEELKKEKSE